MSHRKQYQDSFATEDTEVAFGSGGMLAHASRTASFPERRTCCPAAGKLINSVGLVPVHPDPPAVPGGPIPYASDM